MKCPLCGHEVSVNERFCRNCGENNEYYAGNNEPKVVQPAPQVHRPIQQVPINAVPVQPAPAAVVQPAPVYRPAPVAPVQPAPKPAVQRESLGLGICSIVFGCSFYFCFVGLVLGIVALATSRTKPGRVLSWIGFGISLGLTVIFTIYIIGIIALLA